MKRKTAKEILADSFRELMDRKSADRITVRDITGNCGYSMATFYRQFRDKYDLIAWDYARHYKEVVDQTAEPGSDLNSCFLKEASLFHEQKDYLANLIRHTTGFDSFAENMKAIHLEMIRNYFLSKLGVAELRSKLEMYVRLYSHGSTDLTCDWILGKFEAGTEELAEIYENSLPQPLRQLITDHK